MVNGMENGIHIRYFDGKTSKVHAATLRPIFYQGQADGFIIAWRSANLLNERRYFAKDCEYLPAVSGAHHAILLHDGARVEFLDTPPNWLNLNKQKTFAKISILEQRWAWALGSVAIMCAFVFGVLRFGIPMAAHHIAQRLPTDTLMSVGNQAEKYIMDATKPSRLPQARQDEIVALYQKLNSSPKAKIIVRSGEGEIGANALAIPNNTIIITDELIEISDDNNEILAVLAHEQGHLLHRHTLEQAISSVGMGILVVVITGDTSDLLLTLPTLLTTAQYSQKAELEADRFAIDALKQIGISPKYLANFLKKIDAESGDNTPNISLLSTHPQTDKRISQIEKYSY